MSKIVQKGITYNLEYTTKINSLDYLHECTKCKIIKPNSEFYKACRVKYGRAFYSTCKICTDIYNKTKVRCPIKNRNTYLKYKYNISEFEYKNLYDKQLGRCLICGIHKNEYNKNLSVDHCHTTGKVRGLLCTNCNSLIGHAHDKIEVLEKAIEYLKESINF